MRIGKNTSNNRTPVICPGCGRKCGFIEQYISMILKQDVKCPKCDAVVISVPDNFPKEEIW